MLNMQKLCLRETEVPFIGHVTTAKGLCVDTAKVQAIMEMPAPTDKAGVQRLLGMVQYLSKFLPNLADITKPLCDLTQKEVEWTWGPPQASAFTDLTQKEIEWTWVSLRYSPQRCVYTPSVPFSVRTHRPLSHTFTIQHSHALTVQLSPSKLTSNKKKNSVHIFTR